jgi:hypothetical protein
MSRIAERKTRLSLETNETIRGREIMLEIMPHSAVVRLKGKRTRYEVSWTTVFWKAAEIAAERLRAERKKRREMRRKGLL